MRKTAVLYGAVAATLGAGSIALGAGSDTAPMMSYLGLPQLIAQYGGNLATGSNVHVSIAESGGYPDTSDGRFAGKTMTPASVFTGTDGSNHATNVGARFFGNTTGFSQRSIAPDVPNVWMYTSAEFNGVYLKTPGSAEPYGSPNQSRVASHAYGETNTDLLPLMRLDYLVQRDDFMQVVDTRHYSTQGNAMNAIVVTSSDGTPTLTTAVGTDTPYVAGRTSPTITGPLPGAGSDAIGQVSGVVALLVSRGKTTSSNHSYTTRDTIGIPLTYDGVNFATAPFSGYTVHSGDTSEVVKAALMAGALRDAPADGTLGVAGISDYRALAGNQSANGLDTRYGAGMVNALQSYRIIDAGESDSAEDAGGAGGGIGQYGFDYDPAFGGAGGSNSVATYGFTADADGKFMATLAWNLDIAGASTTGGNFSPASTLHNMALTLTDMTAGGAIVQQSASLVDNTQTLWTDLTGGHVYHLSVTALGDSFMHDYGLAWRGEVALTPTAVPEPVGGVAIAALSAGLFMRRRRSLTC